VGGGGGIGDLIINDSESVLFQFVAGPATNVKFGSSLANLQPNPNLNLEGFDAGGAPLGVVSFDVDNAVSSGGTPIDVSGLLGNVPLSGFAVEGNGTDAGLTIAEVSFVSTVLEPSTLATAAVAGRAGLGALWRRRNKVAP
jgi:hypothetical protein